MSNINKKKFIDRLQFLGIIGPFIVLLTLSAVLLRGSSQGWYLFVVAMIGLPLCWKWRLKGFFITLATLVLLCGCMFPLFSLGEKFWQMGASFSLAIGLFTTYLGFEEIKMMMHDLQIESQSRLDNLIDLDDKYNQSKKDWDLSEVEYKVQVQDKDRSIEKLSEEADSLEKSISIVESELHENQTSNTQYIEELELRATEKSKLDVQLLKINKSMNDVHSQLNLSHSEREKELSSDNHILNQKVADLEASLFEAEEKLVEQEEFETNLSQEANAHELNIKKMEGTLRDKVSEIYELRDQVAVSENETNNQKEGLKSLHLKMTDKDHEIISYKTQITDRDRKINDASKKNRDLDQDLLLMRTDLEEHKVKCKLAEKKLEEREDLLEKVVLEKAQKIGAKDKELENLYQDLEEKGEHLNLMIQRGRATDKIIQEHEGAIADSKESLEEAKQKNFQDLNKLNEARFALFQAGLDKERIRKEPVDKKSEPAKKAAATEKRSRHWLFQVEALLKQDKLKKIDLEKLPKDLSSEILTLNQTKAIYKQLRMQFEDKNKVLDDAREKLFKAETQFEKLNKQHEQTLTEESKVESELEKSLFVKEQEVVAVEEEVRGLNEIIQELLKELNEVKS